MPLAGARRSSLRPAIRPKSSRTGWAASRRSPCPCTAAQSSGADRLGCSSMRTAIVSDLHLGSADGEDLARDPAIRRVAAGGDRRRRPPRPARRRARAARAARWRGVLEAARPFFEELGEAMAGRRVVLVPGNHDHRLAEPLLDEARAGRRHASASSTARLPAGEPATRDRRLARRGRARHRLPGPLAARRRLRHPRPLHGLPHDPAAARVRRRGRRDARRRPTAGSGHARRLRARPAPDLRLRLRPRRGTGLAPRPPPSHPSAAWRAISGRHRDGGRTRQAAARARHRRRRPGSVWLLNRLLPRRLRPRPLRQLDPPQRHRRSDRAGADG